MARTYLAHDVFQAAYDRYMRMLERGDRLVVSCSGGKDSTVCVELAIMAARDAGKLPVEVVMRDEEIMLPGTFEYTERLANRVDEVDFHWVIAGQPIVNIFNRYNPYFWVFDQTLDPDQWVRKYPGFDRGDGPETPPLLGRQPYWIGTQHIGGIAQGDRFPPHWDDIDSYRDPETGEFRLEGRGSLYYDMRLKANWDRPRVVSIMGLRTSESPRRMMGLLSKKSFMCNSPNTYGCWEATPIYDWQDGDVWKFIKDFQIDYNHAYDVMRRMGVPRHRLRIAPPTLTTAGLSQMQAAAKGWPRWFDKVASRLDGVRTAAQFGLRAVQPYRRMGESWQQCFHREVLDAPQVPDWIKERAWTVVENRLKGHAAHAGKIPFPDAAKCPTCSMIGCWKDIALIMYNGDPFAMKANTMLTPIEPEFFREGAGTWGIGKIAFA